MATNKRILLINDNEDVSRYLREELIINGGYLVTFEGTGQGGLETFKHDSFDIVLARYGFADLAGANLVRELRRIDQDCVVIAIVETVAAEMLQEIAALGVFDVVSVPVNLEKILFLVKKGIDLHSFMSAQRKLAQSLQEQNTALQKKNILLAKRIEESTNNLTRLYEDLRSTYMRTIRVLAQAIDSRDHYTHSHSENVARFAVTIAGEMKLSSKDIEMLREASELHDLGKIGIEDSILTKPGALTPQEWEVMKRHPVMGAKILEPLTFLHSVINLVLQHHEHYDGTGYPEGRKGDAILLGARILHLSDAYEAMTSARSYRKVPLSKEAAVQEIKRNNGTQFDPKVVEAFLKVVGTF